MLVMKGVWDIDRRVGGVKDGGGEEGEGGGVWSGIENYVEKFDE